MRETGDYIVCQDGGIWRNPIRTAKAASGAASELLRLLIYGNKESQVRRTKYV